MVSCSTTKSSLQQAKKFQKNFNTKIHLNNTEGNLINLDSVYLDKKNISNIKFDKKSNSIIIFQKNPNAKILNLSEINLDDLSKTIKIKSIVLNGNTLTENDFKNIKFEETAIKDITILINNDLHKGSSNEMKDKTLVITTKK